jgi:Fic family protein
LQHSFRKNGKVITRERYIGKKLPPSEKLDEIKSKLSDECNKEGLFKILGKIKTGFQDEWKRYPESMKEKAKEQIAVAFTYNTNAIEGSTITLEETRELLEHGIAPNRPLRDIKETMAHEKVFLGMLRKEEKFSISLLLKWHKDVFGETKTDIAGRFRDYLVRVDSHLAPDWQDVNKLMRDLTDFYGKSSHMNSVELAARMHYKFEKIHPFGDGNGRVGRLLMNYILWWNKYPMLIIEYKKRRSYYRALQKDEEHFVGYFMRRYLTIHRKYFKPKK